MRGLYIHIPFCSGKCNYCNFTSFAGKENSYGKYIISLKQEMELLKNACPDTLYIGGGTPSELSAVQLKNLFLAIESIYRPISEFVESTFEANPESLTREKIMLLKQFGFNRVSLGLQTFDDRLLKAIGRRHDSNKFADAYIDLRSVGFENINIDVMAGIPEQSFENFNSTIDKVISFHPEHVSVYAMSVEEGTEFYKRGIECNDDLTRAMLDSAREKLLEAGFNHYEISNFAKPKKESIHNTNYWNNGEYVGIGCGASSYVEGVRKTNASILELYCASMLSGEEVIFSCVEKLSGKEKVGESILLGLRKIAGVYLSDEMKQEFGKEITKLQQEGLLKVENDQVRLTSEGIYVSNIVFRHFVPPFD
jgi:oxygen-independent coproporphyrinogen III oxidase